MNESFINNDISQYDNSKAICTDEFYQFCSSDVAENNLLKLNEAFLEHFRKQEMTRIFPSKIHFEESFITELSEANQFMTKWFKQKCEMDSDWC